MSSSYGELKESWRAFQVGHTRESLTRYEASAKNRGLVGVGDCQAGTVGASALETRVIYENDDYRRTVTVLHAGHRRDVYR